MSILINENCFLVCFSIFHTFPLQTLQEELSGALFHPLDDNLLITYGRGHLAFWHRRKDGCFERTDMIKQPNRTCITSVQFEPEGDVITADSDGFISIYSVDAEGMYFIRMEFEAHMKDIGCLYMLPDGTLLSGGEKDRKIAAWDSLQNYKHIADTKLPESAGGIRTIYPQRKYVFLSQYMFQFFDQSYTSLFHTILLLCTYIRSGPG